MENEKRNYYAVIPAEVRYNQNLTANAKLLYGEITALCNEKGYCWATNKYFANLYNVSKSSISNWLRDLTEEGFIQVEIEKNDNNEVISRKIILNINTSNLKNMQ